MGSIQCPCARRREAAGEPNPKAPRPGFALIEVTPDLDTPPGWASQHSVSRREAFARAEGITFE